MLPADLEKLNKQTNASIIGHINVLYNVSEDLFTAVAPRVIQSISRDVRLFVPFLETLVPGGLETSS